MVVQTAVILPKVQSELNLSLSSVSRCAKTGMHEEEKVSFYRAEGTRLEITAVRALAGQPNGQSWIPGEWRENQG